MVGGLLLLERLADKTMSYPMVKPSLLARGNCLNCANLRCELDTKVVNPKNLEKIADSDNFHMRCTEGVFCHPFYCINPETHEDVANPTLVECLNQGAVCDDFKDRDIPPTKANAG